MIKTGDPVNLKLCPYRIRGERRASLTVEGEFYYSEAFMPCMGSNCPCYEDFGTEARCYRHEGHYLILGTRKNHDS